MRTYTTSQAIQYILTANPSIPYIVARNIVNAAMVKKTARVSEEQFIINACELTGKSYEEIVAIMNS